MAETRKKMKVLKDQMKEVEDEKQKRMKEIEEEYEKKIENLNDEYNEIQRMHYATLKPVSFGSKLKTDDVVESIEWDGRVLETCPVQFRLKFTMKSFNLYSDCSNPDENEKKELLKKWAKNFLEQLSQ